MVISVLLSAEETISAVLAVILLLILAMGADIEVGIKVEPPVAVGGVIDKGG